MLLAMEIGAKFGLHRLRHFSAALAANMSMDSLKNAPSCSRFTPGAALRGEYDHLGHSRLAMAFSTDVDIDQSYQRGQLISCGLNVQCLKCAFGYLQHCARLRTLIHSASSRSETALSSEVLVSPSQGNEHLQISSEPFVDVASSPDQSCSSESRAQPQSSVEEREGVAKSTKLGKPMCYYYTQGLCNLMEEADHLAKFSHIYPDMRLRPADVKRVCKQPFDYYLVLDLEGMVEILEFPVVLVDARTLQVVDRFHRFVRPVKMSQERQADYIRGKYGKWGLDRVWHDTAVPFSEVLQSFEGWLEGYELLEPSSPCKLKGAAFVTCGNWDVKTKIPEQCVTSQIALPPYCNEWVNLKDIYLNFYKQRAGGMLAMLRGLKIPMTGVHHVGLDDSHNIARVLQRMLSHGAIVKITAKRNATDPKAVKWTFQNRVK